MCCCTGGSASSPSALPGVARLGAHVHAARCWWGPTAAHSVTRRRRGPPRWVGGCGHRRVVVRRPWGGLGCTGLLRGTHSRGRKVVSPGLGPPLRRRLVVRCVLRRARLGSLCHGSGCGVCCCVSSATLHVLATSGSTGASTHRMPAPHRVQKKSTSRPPRRQPAPQLAGADEKQQGIHNTHWQKGMARTCTYASSTSPSGPPRRHAQRLVRDTATVQ